MIVTELPQNTAENRSRIMKNAARGALAGKPAGECCRERAGADAAAG